MSESHNSVFQSGTRVVSRKFRVDATPRRGGRCLCVAGVQMDDENLFNYTIHYLILFLLIQTLLRYILYPNVKSTQKHQLLHEGNILKYCSGK